MNELANIPGNIVVVLTQQGISNARSSEEDHLKRFITILRGDYKSGEKNHCFLDQLVSNYTRILAKLNNNQTANSGSNRLKDSLKRCCERKSVSNTHDLR